MGKISIKLFVGVVVLLSLSISAQAATVVLTPEKDCYIHGKYRWGWLGWDSMINSGQLNVGRYDAGYWVYEHEYRTLIYFNLSSIPSNAIVESAELRIYYTNRLPSGWNDPQGDRYYVCRLTEDWKELNTRHPPWTERNRPYHVCSGIASTVPASAGWMTWNVTDDVRGFLNGSYKNYGWIIRDFSKSWYSYGTFNSREASSNQPQLIIMYSTTPVPVPELTPLGLIVVAGLIVLSIRKISR